MNKELTHVLIIRKLEEKNLRHLEENLSGGISLHFTDKEYDLGSISVLVSGRSDRSVVEELTNLKYLIIPFAGLSEELRAYLPDFPTLSVHNLHHNAVPVAENTIALLMAAAKNIIPPHNALMNADWRPRYVSNPSRLLHGKTILILGYGTIGKHIAKYLKPYDMLIMATRNSIESRYEEDGVTVYPASQTMSLLSEANYLIIALPLTTETENLIGEKEINSLPDGAVLVNIGRGKIVNQKALYEGLSSGKLGAAAIDVWYNYPKEEADRANTPSSDYPLHELDNIVMSPHRAGGVNSEDTERFRMEHLARLLNLISEGKELPNKVDLTQGY